MGGEEVGWGEDLCVPMILGAGAAKAAAAGHDCGIGEQDCGGAGGFGVLVVDSSDRGGELWDILCEMEDSRNDGSDLKDLWKEMNSI